MTAIRATFSDFKLIKTRKVAVLCLEVPIEQANAALAALGGVPQFGEEQWVGVAPLTAENAPAPATSQEIWDVAQNEIKKRKTEMTRAQWAGMLCQDEKFQEFLWRNYTRDQIHRSEMTEERAARVVRSICGIESRTVLSVYAANPGAADKWDTLRTEYDAWRGKIGRPE